MRQVLDHAVRAYRHYSAQQGSTLAAAITYFAFLSLFPLLALAFAGVGFVAQFVPDAHEALDEALKSLLPGMIGDQPNQISLSAIQRAAGPVAGIGILTVGYSGLSWVSEMREALAAMFGAGPSSTQSTGLNKVATYVVTQIHDVVSMALVGLVLLFSVIVSGGLLGFLSQLRQGVGAHHGLGFVVSALLIAVGVASSTVLFYVVFRLFAEPRPSSRSLWSGALLGGIGFECLKQASTWLLGSTVSQPAFQAFGITLILLAWMYYFSRLIMFAAAWARTDARH